MHLFNTKLKLPQNVVEDDIQHELLYSQMV